jgi:hypothetical protein
MSPLERAARAAARSYGFDDAEYDALPEINANPKGVWDKQGWREIARAVLASIRDDFHDSDLVEGARQMKERGEGDAATSAAIIYDGVVDWLDAAAAKGS